MGVCFDNGKLWVVEEFMSGGNLSTLLRNKTLMWAEKFQIALGIARGFRYSLNSLSYI